MSALSYWSVTQDYFFEIVVAVYGCALFILLIPLHFVHHGHDDFAKLNGPFDKCNADFVTAYTTDDDSAIAQNTACDALVDGNGFAFPDGDVNG